ncbi:prostaglandin reductase 1 [Aplysia californica]|uniref:15-oxoprostaglandin 13-reductase n=1 Tax=Aplysia californica TaxID=6500 RepID=A0ABM1A3U9_APLCA|nr:prostaglandin reductase 1 [Aplysia californica]
MVVAKVWKTVKPFEGTPKITDFELVEEKLADTLKPDEILIEAVFFTVDPYIRTLNLPTGLPAEQVGRIMESKARDFPKGALVLAHVGWRSHAILNVKETMNLGFKPTIVPKVPGLSPSLWLGVIGMPGVTAYLAFLERCAPKSGDVVIISAASGAVGSMVGQLARAKGCKVIGSAGSKEKCDWLLHLGFSYVFNYKTTSVEEALTQAAPEGVDIYYDNVGGEFTDAVMSHLKPNARVLICGQIADYNRTRDGVPNPFGRILFAEAQVRGFFIFNHLDEFPRVRKEIISLVQQKKLQPRETITNGFENMAQAFIDLFKGANIGKSIIKV